MFWRQDLKEEGLQALHLPKSRKAVDWGCLMWNNPDSTYGVLGATRFAAEPSDGKLKSSQGGWERGSLRPGSKISFWTPEKASKFSKPPWFQWVLALLSTKLLLGRELFFFFFHHKMPIHYNGNTLQGCIASVREARLFSYPTPWLLAARPGRMLQSCRPPSSDLTLPPIPIPSVPLCLMAKLPLTCEGEAAA